MVAETGERATPTLNTTRIEDIKRLGSYFDARQVRILDELGDYVQQRGEIPTAEKLAAFTTRPEADIRNDLNRVTLEGFLWVFGVEA